LPYDEGLAERLRKTLKGTRGLEEKKLFGGVGFLVNGNMACGVHKQELMLRIDPAGHEAALQQPHVRVFDITGRPMKGWVLVAAEGFRTQAGLAKWVRKSVAYAQSLPAKGPG